MQLAAAAGSDACAPSPAMRRRRPMSASSMAPSPILTTARKGVAGLSLPANTSMRAGSGSGSSSSSALTIVPPQRRPQTHHLRRRGNGSDVRLKSMDISKQSAAEAPSFPQRRCGADGGSKRHCDEEKKHQSYTKHTVLSQEPQTTSKPTAQTATNRATATNRDTVIISNDSLVPRPRTRERIPIRFHRVAPGETPTVLFPYPPGLKLPKRTDPAHTVYRPKKWPRMKYLLYWERNCIKTVFNAAGLVRSKDKDPARHPANTIQGSGDWNVAWSKHFPIEQYRLLRPEQRINSFPGTGCIGRKDTLAAIMDRFDRRFPQGGPFGFLPQTFILRGHYGEMDRFLRAARKRAGHRDPQVPFTTTERRRRGASTRSSRAAPARGRRSSSKERERQKRRNRARRRKFRGRGNKSDNSDDSDDSDGSDDSDDSDSELETVERKDARILSEDRKSIENLRRRASMDQDRMGSRVGLLDNHEDGIAGGDDKYRSKFDDCNGHDLWICKPSGGSCGRGIQLCRYKDVKKLPMTYPSKNVLGERVQRQRVWNVQEYIADPLCIEGRKFDLRVYVLVTSFDPLRVYVFREGLCRICTQEYDLDYDHLDDTFRHLTNFSINKNADDFIANEDADKDDYGHKWSLSALFDHLDAHGYDVKRLWRDMKEVAVKTLIACESEVFSKHQTLNGADKCCYEVFGFDMLLNESLYVYLIEVNIYPSMATGSPLDKRIKQTMIADALQIKGVPMTGAHGPSAARAASRNSSRLNSKQKREVLRKRLRTGKLGKFSDEDLSIVRESAAEFSRAATTNYDIAFPCASSIKRMAGYFISPRYNNTLLHMLIQQEEDEDEDDSQQQAEAQLNYDPYPTSKSPPRRRQRQRRRRKKR